MRLEQLQEIDFVLAAEIAMHFRITTIMKMVDAISEDLKEIETLYEVVRTKKRWVRL